MSMVAARPPARATAAGTWIAGLDSPGEVRLLCFPHAGGGSRFYRPWSMALGAAAAVCPVLLPGREGRWSEPPATHVAEITGPMAEAVRSLDDRPFALFGHSMGAGLAHALACRLAADPTAPVPAALLVSGRPAPFLPQRLPPAHDLPQHEFLARLQHLNGTPPEVLAERALMEAFLPLLRADFGLNETYRPSELARLSIPVLAAGGRGDPLAAPDELLAWRRTTTGPFTLRLFEGDHFYLKEPPPGLVAAIVAALAGAVGPAGQAALR